MYFAIDTLVLPPDPWCRGETLGVAEIAGNSGKHHHSYIRFLVSEIVRSGSGDSIKNRDARVRNSDEDRTCRVASWLRLLNEMQEVGSRLSDLATERGGR
jgi:hypothetical protein